MTDSKAMKELIRISGLKYKSIAEKLDLTPYGLQKKINNVTEFKASEIQLLCDILNITDPELRHKIFFEKEVDLNSTNNNQ